MATLSSYLRKIEAEEPICFEVFRRLLLRAGYIVREISEAFAAVKIGPNTYTVSVLNEAFFWDLLVKYTPSGVDGRIGAALDGDSHKAGVSASLPLIRSLEFPHPVVVIVDQFSWIAPRPVKRFCVVAENLESFIRFDDTFALLANLLPNEVGDIELMLGAGNQITNRLNAEFLRSFDQVYCLFDVDLGGLKMFATLRALLPGKPPRFLYPEDIHQRLATSRFLLSMEQRQRLNDFAGMGAETDALITTMRATGRMLEQEAYLTPSPIQTKD